MAKVGKNGLLVFQTKSVTPKDFVSYWSFLYNDPREHMYENNISKPFTPESIEKLYIWKNGSILAPLKKASVKKNYINRIDEVEKLPLNTTAEAFLECFSEGGAIWRIFWLHCWQPDRFPIYDMHVHRAMALIENQAIREIENLNDKKKIVLYLDYYLPFIERFAGIHHRDVDRALWAFGKFSKKWNLLGVT